MLLLRWASNSCEISSGFTSGGDVFSTIQYNANATSIVEHSNEKL